MPFRCPAITAIAVALSSAARKKASGHFVNVSHRSSVRSISRRLKTSAPPLRPGAFVSAVDIGRRVIFSKRYAPGGVYEYVARHSVGGCHFFRVVSFACRANLTQFSALRKPARGYERPDGLRFPRRSAGTKFRGPEPKAKLSCAPSSDQTSPVEKLARHTTTSRSPERPETVFRIIVVSCACPGRSSLKRRFYENASCTGACVTFPRP